MNWETLKISFTKYDKGKSKFLRSENEGFAANVKVEFLFVTNYKNIEGVVEHHKIDSNFIYALTNDEAIKHFGRTAMKELKNKFFIDSHTNKNVNSWLDANSLNLEEKKDKFFNDDNLLADYFNNYNFKDNLI